MNLTSVVDKDGVQARHFLDSLSVVLALPDGLVEHCKVVDVGAGGGFPGVPLKIVFPEIRLTLIDSTAKKTAFLIHLVEALEIDRADVLTGRLEELGHDPSLREGFDLVVARAVAKLPVLAELTLPLCRVGGLVVCQKGASVEEELLESEGAVDTLGGEIQGIVPVDLPELEQRRSLVVLKKVRSTPEAYPRRPGIPFKRPIRRLQRA